MLLLSISRLNHEAENAYNTDQTQKTPQRYAESFNVVFKMMLFYIWIMVYYSIVKSNEDCAGRFSAAGFTERNSEVSVFVGSAERGEGKSSWSAAS